MDTIYHLAGTISIMPGENLFVWKINLEGTRNMLEAAQRAGIRRFVYTSSIHAIKRIGGHYFLDIQDCESYAFSCVAERFGEYWE